MAVQLDPVIHPVGRLKVCAALSAAGATEGDVRYEMRFAHLREVTGLSDTTLSKQLSALEEHGYITRFREYGSTRAKDTVWVTLTRKGKEAFDGHVAALREIAAH
ncbi:MarR family transcriptional regulator [Corynebacterium sanguinis]|nr:transcriptional regulator [Corynebacterium sanguinis]MCT1444144.1 transcriptional regulator [Corynebacterium sanguinis]MCT1597229.1 transcriptional regulator [Corynebacterium sanguinis]QDR77705.1 MarR family transcriptional regulator [Corynebacterium sanguinis]